MPRTGKCLRRLLTIRWFSPDLLFACLRLKYFLTIFAAGITERAPLAAPSIGEVHENGLRSTVAGGCWWIGLGYCHYRDRHQSQ